MTKLTFAIDFDDTFTACPGLWARFVKDAEQLGHRVVLVTCRRDTDENIEKIRAALAEVETTLPIVCSKLGSKRAACEKRGYKVDIWIDDNPDTVERGM